MGGVGSKLGIMGFLACGEPGFACDGEAWHVSGRGPLGWPWGWPDKDSVSNISMRTRLLLLLTGTGSVDDAGAVSRMGGGGSRDLGTGIHGAIGVG